MLNFYQVLVTVRCLSFSFVSRFFLFFFFLISSLISSVICWLFSSILFRLFFKTVFFLVGVLVRKDAWYDFSFLKVTVAQHVVCSGECSMYTWDECVFCCFQMECSLSTPKSIWPNGSFKACIYLLLFCPDIPTDVYISGVLNSPTITALLLISPLWLLACAYTLSCLYARCLSIYNCFIFLDWSFDHYIVPFFVSWNSLYFKAYFVWVLLLQPSFDFRLHGIPFSIPFLSVYKCPYHWSGSLVDGIYMGLVFVSIQLLLSFGWSIESIYIWGNYWYVCLLPFC